MTDIRTIETFVAIAQAGSLSAAARRTGLPVSTLSRHLQALERSLGQPLVMRSTRRFTLTEAGETLLENVHGPLRQLRVATETLREQMDGRPSGLLRIAAAPTVAQFLLCHIVARCLEHHPDLDIELSAAPERADLRRDGIDVAVRVGSLDRDPSLVVRHLQPCRLKYVATPGYLRRRAASVTATALEEQEVIALTQPDWQLLAASGKRIDPRIRVPSAAIAYELCRQGVGVALLPDFLVAQDLRDGRLIEVAASERRPRLQLFLAYLPENKRAPRVRAFVDLVLKALGESKPRSAPA